MRRGRKARVPRTDDLIAHLPAGAMGTAESVSSVGSTATSTRVGAAVVSGRGEGEKAGPVEELDVFWSGDLVAGRALERDA